MEQEVRAGSAEFGQLLRRYRLAAGLSQEALAERARMSTEGISALERGYRRSPQRETLELLAGALALDDEQRRDFESAARAGLARRPGSASSVTVGPWLESGTAALPLALTTYVGREREMAAIAALLRESRLVTLTGAGGIGKTRTALQAAAALDDDSEYPPRFVSLTSAADGASVTRSIAAALGVQEVPNHSLSETLRSYLHGKAMLLILDNCEHVIDDVAQLVETLLAGSPRVRVLATSREPLRVAGEHAYRLPSLAIPSRQESRALRAGEALEYGAVRLFVDRARAVNHRFELTDDDVSNLAELCRHLDGIPLAIELAAARANTLSVRELDERLGERFRLLAGGERTASPRQQTMRAAIDWSYNLLSAPEQRLFERLSVFAGGCTLSAAAQIYDDNEREADVLDLLAALADKSLVVAALNGETRYRLLESFREYAREKLAARGELEPLAHRHALVCLRLVRAYNRAADANLDQLFRAEGACELENWRAALEWTLGAGNDVLLGQELAAELDTVWHTFAPVEGRRWLAAAEHAGGPTPPATLAALSLAQAHVALLLGEDALQLAYSQAALSHYRSLNDPLGIAQAQSRVGNALVWSGQVREGTALLREALECARGLKNGRLTAFALRCLSLSSAENDHDYATARRYASEALQVLEAMGATLTAAAATELAQYEFAAGNLERAAQLTTTQLAIVRSANMAPRIIVVRLCLLACYLNAAARFDEAEDCGREALDLARQHDLEDLALRALQCLAATGALREHAPSKGSRETWTRAARILGFAHTRLTALRTTPLLPELQEYDRVLAVLRSAIGDAAVAEAMTAGSAMTQEQAIDQLEEA